MPAMTEGELQSAVIETAKRLGWMIHHSRPAQTGGRWSTPITGDKGLPDLVLARRGRVLFIELKTRKGRLSPEQLLWQEAIGEAYHVIRPDDYDRGRVHELLR